MSQDSKGGRRGAVFPIRLAEGDREILQRAADVEHRRRRRAAPLGAVPPHASLGRFIRASAMREALAILAREKELPANFSAALLGTEKLQAGNTAQPAGKGKAKGKCSACGRAPVQCESCGVGSHCLLCDERCDRCNGLR